MIFLHLFQHAKHPSKYTASNSTQWRQRQLRRSSSIRGADFGTEPIKNRFDVIVAYWFKLSLLTGACPI